MNNAALARRIYEAGVARGMIEPQERRGRKAFTVEDWEPLLDDIKDYWREHLYGPSVRDICRMAGYNSTSAAFHAVRCMQDLGMVTFSEERARSVAPVGMRVVFDCDESVTESEEV
jgi:hypothetical protein